MKSQMSSFDIAAIVLEFQSLVGFKVEKVFFPDYHEFFFRLEGNKEKKTIFIKVGQAIWLENGFKPAESELPPTFAMLMRKHLAGLRLEAVYQQGFDRVVVFEFGSEENIRLIAEMFGSGNVILVKGDTIIQPLTSKSWRARDVKAGKKYEFPPESANPFELDEVKLTEVLSKSEKDLVRCLAVGVNLGGAHAEEVCKVLGVEKDVPASEMGVNEVKRILEIIALFDETLKEPAPYIVMEEGQAVTVQPFWLSIYSNSERKEFETFSQAAREYFTNLPDKLPTKEVPGDGNIARLERQIEQQKAAVEDLRTVGEEFKIAGDRLYAEYQGANEVLEQVQRILEGGNWQAAKKIIEELNGIEHFDPSSGVFVLKLDDAVSVRLDARLNLNDNASLLYEHSKKAKHKMDGAIEAMAETKKELASQISDAEERESTERAKKKPTKRFWFEKFKWFLTTEGVLVIAGRDAKTNDQVVKKHLKDGDLYAHADIQGAPSVVIKEGSGASEGALTEACIFAVCHSKSWKGKTASGSAYWVKPDQVSKTPQPGEFLPKGAFIIRGKRNYSKKLEMKMAVGKVVIEGEEKVMCAPPDAIASRTDDHFVITPGEENRQQFSKTLSNLYNVPIEEIDRVLPPGDLRIISKPRKS